MLSSERSPHRVLVIGFDGASFDVVEPWIRAGKLPTLARLMQEGGGGNLRSVLPVMSPAAWVSFYTGVNPGKHGVFDFSQRMANSYKLRLVTSQDAKAPAIWRLLSDAGKRVAVVNVPITYPAESVNGVMITGLGTPDLQVFTYPPELSQTLRAHGYRVNKTVLYRPGGEEAFLKDVYDITARVGNVALNLLKQELWDFFMVVFRDSDEMGHFFWKHMDSLHPAHDSSMEGRYANAMLEYYQYLDQWADKLITAAGPNVNVIIMSDHGCGPLYKDVFLNEWLRQKNWQHTSVDITKPQGGILGVLGITRASMSRLLQQTGLAAFERWLRLVLGDQKKLLPAHNRPVYPDVIDWPNSIAYSYGYHGQVFINVKGREPLGVVTLENYQEIRSNIKHALESLVDPEDGLPVVSEVVTQEQAFQGPYAQYGADLIVTMRDLAYITRLGYEFGNQIGRVFSRPSTHESGSHRLKGMLFLHGPDFQAHRNLPMYSILDLAPTILHLLGVPVVEHMDGSVLLNELNQDLQQVTMASYGNFRPADHLGPDLLTEEEENELSERLKNLGYLG